MDELSMQKLVCPACQALLDPEEVMERRDQHTNLRLGYVANCRACRKTSFLRIIDGVYLLSRIPFLIQPPVEV
jgi:hypothetical protein